MKKNILLAALCFFVATAIHARAEILWVSDFEQFRFDVVDNGGWFHHDPTGYHQFKEDTEFFSYNPSQTEFDPYTSIAMGSVVEFVAPPGEIRLNAMAKGPDGGVNPPNGLIVQGYLETVPTDLTASDHGIEAFQEVLTFVSRRFTVDRNEAVRFTADLSGVIDFDAFGSNGDNYHATYTVNGEVMLKEVVGEALETVTGFPLALNDQTRKKSITVDLVTHNESQQPVEYKLTVRLNLQSEFINYDLQSGAVTGIIDGTFELGKEGAPLKLTVNLKSGSGGFAPGIPLLLLDN